MKYIVTIIVFFSFINLNAQSYLQYSRVKRAYDEKINFLTDILSQKDINSLQINILLTIYKKEKQIVVWVKEKNQTTYDSLITYDFCRLSGHLGPKRQTGDMQVPEGLYYISLFNPYSSYELSLKISYPNQSDLILGDKNNQGNNIYIHGGCLTAGCIPITDDKIKELYLLASFAKEIGQTKIPIYIFPTRLTNERLTNLLKNKENLKNIKLWQNLKQGYDIFVNNKKELDYSINSEGEYIFLNVN
ncbi:MAG: L,D-transpeptidase family protein [Bacteroidales bacterium]|nr:L,D-transpeptidase family protein [Bacteroidales bacterium]